MVSKCQRKEKAMKDEHDQEKQPIEDATGGDEESRTVVETELPITHSADIPEVMTSSPIDLEEIGSQQSGEGMTESKAVCTGLGNISWDAVDAAVGEGRMGSVSITASRVGCLFRGSDV